MPSPAELLAKVEKALSAGDTASLSALEREPDKDVRKAARRALHRLRTRGVQGPEPEHRLWSVGPAQDLRGLVEPAAILDTRGTPGATRIALTLPDDEGCTLFLALMGADDRMLDFGRYGQTDGQRARMVRDWERSFGDRRVPVEWARQRIRWSRERTLALGFSVSRALDDALIRLGDATAERPASFIAPQIAEVVSSEGDVVHALVAGGVAAWPVLFDANALFESLATRVQAGVTELSEELRRDGVRNAISEDVATRAALSGLFAHALEDAAIALWLEGTPDVATRLHNMASELRTATDPSSVEGAAELVQLQLAAALRASQHDHDHDHDHAHDHDHDHDHECDDPTHDHSRG